MTLGDALRSATERLSARSDTPRLDAELLAAHCLGIDRTTLLLEKLQEATPLALEGLITRRLSGEPIAYITGHADFWTLTLRVSPAVLIPRPDSETLIEAAIDHFGAAGPRSILDLGTGSGALLFAALAHWPASIGVGVDRSEDALAVAAENARSLGLDERVSLRLGHWADDVVQTFDLILCNPPYIADDYPLAPDVADFEPACALFSGADGLDDYAYLAPEIGRLMNDGGCACIEIGFDQAQTAGALFEGSGLQVDVRQDLGGRNRCLVVRKVP